MSVEVTGWKLAGTGATADRDGKTAWTNPGNVTAKDATYATVSAPKGDYVDWLRATNFGFTTTDIPVGSTIINIDIRIRQYASGADAYDSALYLRRTAGQFGNNYASAVVWPTSAADRVYEALSGESLTAADLFSSDFGVDLSGQSASSTSARTLYVDSVEIRVRYVTASKTYIFSTME